MPKERKSESQEGGFGLSWRWLLFIWVALIGAQLLLSEATSRSEIPYSEFRRLLAEDEIEQVTVGEDSIRGTFRSPVDGEETFRTVRVEDEKLYERLEEEGVAVTGERGGFSWGTLLLFLAPVLLLVLLFSFLRRRMGGSGGLGFSAFGRSRAKLHVEEDIGVSFDDVAGVEESKEELAEVIQFLKYPQKFQRLGGKLPKGILLVGPPGTGKTLLARAVAGEAGVPFFSISGSEFVEMFVGVGAARVRDLFNSARQKAPCIVFIDELDALGKARGVANLSNEEREQTLNQLLVELDGFDPHVGVILMAATNRPEILDPALLRAGRFDRQVLVDRPDKAGRVAILGVHAREVKLAEDVELEQIAAMTPGFAGADLANIINEAALLAVRRSKEVVGQEELREAVERVIAGLEKRNRVLTPAEKERVAHHETGHALVALLTPGADEVQKISIIPRGIAALGYTLQLPTEDRFLMTGSELEDKISMLLGGRVAEELIFGEVSTGAQDDLRKATDVARSMVEVYGMSDRLGKVTLEREAGEAFLGGPRGPSRPAYSEQTAREIDCEVRRIIDEQYARTRELLVGVEPALRRAAATLMEKETMSGEELRAVLEETRRECAADELSGRVCVS